MENFALNKSHEATLADVAKFGLDYQPFHKKGVCFEAFTVTSNVNPVGYENGKVLYARDDYEGVDSLMFVFGMAEGSDTEASMKAIGAWTHNLKIDGEKQHIAYRTLGNFDDRKLRAFVYRVYLNDDGQCFEHPEMLKGTPMGMYHCPVCMEMVIAGLRHPSKAELREFHEENTRDIREGHTPEGEENE